MIDATTMTRDEVAEVVIRLMAQHIKQDSAGWTTETELEAIGIDSFEFVEFVFIVEDEFGIDIEYNANDMSKSLRTIGAVADAIKTVVAAKTAAHRGVQAPEAATPAAARTQPVKPQPA